MLLTENVFRPPFTLSGVTWGLLSETWGAPWVTLEPLRRTGVTFGHLWATLGHLGATLGHFDVTLGQFGVTWEPLGSHLGTLGSHFGALWRHFKVSLG